MDIFIVAYLLAMSAAGFIVCACDKRAALRKRRRVKESALFFVAALGGSAGVFLAMIITRHKTRQARFMLLMPMMIVLHAVLFVLLLKRF